MDARLELVGERPLVFDDGTPVRAASGIAPFGDGWLVAQDDSTLAAWWRPAGIEPVRLFPPVDGLDWFSEADGTKRLKPDVETACVVPAREGPGVLLLGSGSLPARMRGALALVGRDHRPRVVTAELGGLYASVGRALGRAADELNLEGAVVEGGALRWYQRGLERQGVPSASVDVDLEGLLAALHGACDPAVVELDRRRAVVIGRVRGHELAVTDAARVPVGERVVVTATAEDAPDPVADGPVVGSAVALLDAAGELLVRADVAPGPDGAVRKLEGVAVRGVAPLVGGGEAIELLAVEDQDDPALASPALELRLTVRPTVVDGVSAVG
jgi:hypothetical protein